MKTVSLPKAIAALFSNAHKDFPAIISKPSNDDLQRLCQRNFQALQDIGLGDSTDATGIILSEVNHKAANKDQVFNPANKSLVAYNPAK